MKKSNEQQEQNYKVADIKDVLKAAEKCTKKYEKALRNLVK